MAGRSVGRVAMLILGVNARDDEGSSKKTRRVERRRNDRCVLLIVDNGSKEDDCLYPDECGWRLVVEVVGCWPSRNNVPNSYEKWHMMTASSSSIHLNHFRAFKPFQRAAFVKKLLTPSTKAWARLPAK